TRAEIDQREPETAGHHGIESKFVAKPLSINGGRTVQIGQADCMLGAEIVIDPRLSVGEPEYHWRLVAEIVPIRDVLKIAYANVCKPRAPFGGTDRSF